MLSLYGGDLLTTDGDIFNSSETDVRIADNFTDSIAHLAGDAHNIAKTTASDVHLTPPDRGMVFELFRLAGVPFYDQPPPKLANSRTLI